MQLLHAVEQNLLGRHRRFIYLVPGPIKDNCVAHDVPSVQSVARAHAHGHCSTHHG